MKAIQTENKNDALLVPASTLALWLLCVAVGGTGLILSYARPRSPEKVAPALTAELLNVELAPEALPPNATPPPAPQVMQPPPLNQPLIAPQAPPMLAVAEPSPQIAFAVPVAAPARVVPPSEASFRSVEAPVVSPAPAPAPVAAQPLTFGQGEGKQPAPEYPRQSLREGQEGTVVVRLTVGENGRVMAADAASPSPWPLLNESALRVVRHRWRFASGSLRAYEVAIRFTLRK